MQPARHPTRRFVLLAAAALWIAALAAPALAADHTGPHRIAVQVDVNDPATMNLALGNIGNIYDRYKTLGQEVTIELVAFGPGLTMLRDDISPVKEKLAALHAAHPQLVLSACQNSLRAATKAEGHAIPIVPEASPVPSGVVRLSELQEQGYTYIRP